jgi:hypothetical protein
MLEIALSKAFLNRVRSRSERDGEKAIRVFQPLQLFLRLERAASGESAHR